MTAPLARPNTDPELADLLTSMPLVPELNADVLAQIRPFAVTPVEPLLDGRAVDRREVTIASVRVPGQVDKPAAWRALDVRALEVGAARRRDRGAVDGPGGSRRVTGDQAEQLIWPGAVLNTDVDAVVAAGLVGAGATGAAGQLR